MPAVLKFKYPREGREKDEFIVYPMRSIGRVLVPNRYKYAHDRNASRRNLVLLYARLGLHRYNFLLGKDLQLSNITLFTKTNYSAASSYKITFDVKDPAETSGSLQTFQAQVNEQKYGEFMLVCTSSGPPGEPQKYRTVTSNSLDSNIHLTPPTPKLPPENPFEDDTDRFRVLKKSEVLKNDWIRLYLELAVATTNRRHIKHGVSNLKILKVAMEITRDLEPFTKGLGAYDAIFYIRYKDSCKSRAGDDIDRVAIVRRIVDVHSEIFKIVGCTQTFTPAASNGIAAMEAGSSSAQD